MAGERVQLEVDGHAVDSNHPLPTAPGSGGSGGTVSQGAAGSDPWSTKVADGGNATVGAKGDAAWDGSAAAATVVAILKAIYAKVAATLGFSTNAGTTNATTLRVITASDGPLNTNLGTTADAAVTTDIDASVSSKLRGLIKVFADIWDSTKHALKSTQVAATAVSATLQNAQTGNANGSTLDVTGQSSVVFTVAITGTATVNFEGTEDGTTWAAIKAGTLGDSSIATTTTASGVFQAACAGLTAVRARTSGTSPTPSVTVTAHAVPIPWNSRSVVVSTTAPTPTHTADATVSGSTQILAANTARKLAVVQVVSGGNARVAIADTPTASKGIQLGVGGTPLFIEGTASYACPTGAVNAIKEGSSSAVISVTEFA